MNNMLEHLFGSKTRLKLLRTFFREPEKCFYVRELVRMHDVQINAIRRELEALCEAGIVKASDAPATQFTADKSIHLRKYYCINPESILYSELHALLIKEKMLGEQEFIDEIKDKGGDIKLFLLSGRFTQDNRAPSDMFIVGNLKERIIEKIVEHYERELGFEIRYTLMAEKEFLDRRHIMDKFVYTMFEARHVKVVNVLNL